MLTLLIALLSLLLLPGCNRLLSIEPPASLECALDSVEGLARVDCDPIEQCGCPAGQTCILKASGKDLQAVCSEAGTAPRAATCTDDTECAVGLGCYKGQCAELCRLTAMDGAETDGCSGRCEAIASLGSELADWGACYLACGSDPPCPEGLACDPGEETPGACVVPYPEGACPSRLLGNGRCDGPSGTGLCLADTEDTGDCGICQETVPGASCDPLTNCGCSAGKDCKYSYSATAQASIASCVDPGVVARGERCRQFQQCEAGTTCLDGLCLPYCVPGTADSCDGFCLALTDKLGGCYQECEFLYDRGCPAGQHCSSIVEGAAICVWSQTVCPQQLLENGRCDGPSGTRYCVRDADDQVDCDNAKSPACETTSFPDAPCEPGQTCGCAPGEQCQFQFDYSTGISTTECNRPGTAQYFDLCESNQDCALGSTCVAEGFCAPFCDPNDPADCEGFCAEMMPGFGYCMLECDFLSGTGCPDEYTCANPFALEVCLVPQEVCPELLRNNGECHGPSGNHYCARDEDDAVDCGLSSGE